MPAATLLPAQPPEGYPGSKALGSSGADRRTREGISFDKRSPETFSKAMLEAGLYFLASDSHFAAAHLDLGPMTELAAVLEQGTATADDIATILGIIGAAKRRVTEHPETIITSSRYDELRDELAPALGWESRRGATPWPPTRQTLMDRYTYRNTALESVGMIAAKIDATGLVKFSEKLCEKAIRDSVTEMLPQGLHPSHQRYTDWSADMILAGMNTREFAQLLRQLVSSPSLCWSRRDRACSAAARGACGASGGQNRSPAPQVVPPMALARAKSVTTKPGR